MATSLSTTLVETFSPDLKSGTKTQEQFILARVTHVVLGPVITGSDVPDPYYKVPTDIGNITYQILQKTQSTTRSSKSNPLAKPIHSVLKQLPVEGEIVLLVAGPSPKLNKKTGQQDYYYLNPFNLWNSSHHNAFPHLEDVATYASTNRRSYEQTATINQSINQSVSGSNKYPLNPGFNELPDIKNLRPFIGDSIVESRWGSSIRLGSTTVDKIQNNWSNTGSVGNPIMIIRNGQGRQENNISWFPTVENINRDPSSIYLTQGQELVIDDINNNFSLSSLGISLQSSITVSIPLQQQLTSNDTISPSSQDQNISSNV